MNFYDIFMFPLEKRILKSIRRNIIPAACGDVLEIGYGTGVNFQYYNPREIKSFSALEIKPDTSIAAKAQFPVRFVAGQAEHLPFPDMSFDSVVETLLLCSVNDLNTAIGEVLRVLKPGGIFIFIDHVLPEKKQLAALFRTANLIWPKVAGGCNLTREPQRLIEASGFVIEESGKRGLDVFRWGIARKPLKNEGNPVKHSI